MNRRLQSCQSPTIPLVATEDAVDEHVDERAPFAAADPDPAPIGFIDSFGADEPELLIVRDEEVEELATHRPAFEAPPSAESLEDFQAFTRSQFSPREKPTSVDAPDELKMLGLDPDETVSIVPPSPTPATGELPDQGDPASPVATSFEPDSFIEYDSTVIEEGASPSRKGTTVRDAMLEGDCSVRLANCIAANPEFFSDWTIDRALANRSEFAAALMHVRNLGRKTANEALDALEACAQAQSVEGEFEEHTETDTAPSAGLDPARLDEDLRSVLDPCRVSVRLANVVAGGALDGLTVRDFVKDPGNVRARLMGSRNVGRKTVVEAVKLLVAYTQGHVFGDDAPVVADPLAGFEPAHLNGTLREALERRHTTARLANLIAAGALDSLTVRDFVVDPNGVRARLLGCKNAGRTTAVEAMGLLAAHVEGFGQPDLDFETPGRTDAPSSERITTGEWVRQEVGSLSPKHVEVLYGRYGLEGRARETLENIAKRVHVTRERVRQVEAKALKRLRDERRSSTAFARYLAEERDAQWGILFGSLAFLHEDRISEKVGKLDPWFKLGIDVLFDDGIEGYLHASAHKTDGGWFKNSAEADDRRHLDLLGPIDIQDFQRA